MKYDLDAGDAALAYSGPISRKPQFGQEGCEMPPSRSASIAPSLPDARLPHEPDVSRKAEPGGRTTTGPSASTQGIAGETAVVDELRDRWSRFWSERQARKREQLIAAGRAAIERYTPSARRCTGPEIGCRAASPTHREPAIRLRIDRDR